MVRAAVAVQRGLQSIISDLRLLDPNIELPTLQELWFRYQFASVDRKRMKMEANEVWCGAGGLEAGFGEMR